MCPPTPASPIAFGLWTDEELVLSLEEIIHGNPLPSNVIKDVNPYKYPPSNLPDGIWYFNISEDKKDTEHGFWKAKGDPCEIFTNSVITGWRTTLKYYEGQGPHGRRTNWVMQEYRITRKGLCNNRNTKDSGSLCRLFHSEEQSPDLEMHPKHGGADIGGRSHFHLNLSSHPKADSTTGQGSMDDAQDKNGDDGTGPSAVAERLLDPSESKYVLNGDYLELDDLDDPQSPSSSSDNSCCPTFTSDECFDSLALLRDLGDENEDRKGEDANLKYSVSASKPNEVIMCPATLGKLSAEGTRKSDYSLPGSAIIEGKMDKRFLNHAIRCQPANEVASSSQNAAASSSSHKAVTEKEKKNLGGRMKKLKKKYFCLMPF